MHVSVTADIAIVIVPIRRSFGVMGRLGDISHRVESVSCWYLCTRISLRYLLSVRDDTSISSINTSSVMLLILLWQGKDERRLGTTTT